MVGMIFWKESVSFRARIMLHLLMVDVENGTGRVRSALLALHVGPSMSIKYVSPLVIFARPPMIMEHALLATVVMT